MSDDLAHLICTHVHVPEVRPDISSARFQFVVQRAHPATGINPTDPVEILMPYQVLLSIANALPQLLGDMKAMGADKVLFEVPPGMGDAPSH